MGRGGGSESTRVNTDFSPFPLWNATAVEDVVTVHTQPPPPPSSVTQRVLPRRNHLNGLIGDISIRTGPVRPSTRRHLNSDRSRPTLNTHPARDIQGTHYSSETWVGVGVGVGSTGGSVVLSSTGSQDPTRERSSGKGSCDRFSNLNTGPHPVANSDKGLRLQVSKSRDGTLVSLRTGPSRGYPSFPGLLLSGRDPSSSSHWSEAHPQSLRDETSL